MKNGLLVLLLLGACPLTLADVTVNGKTYQGSSVKVIDGDVYIDGKLVDKQPGNRQIVIHGDVGSLTSDQSVKVMGDVKGNVIAGGSVNVGNVGGNVDAQGSVNAAQIHGNTHAGGSIICHQ